MTEGMKEAEAVMRATNRAASHCRSPELVMRQWNAALGKKSATAMRKQMPPPLRATFEVEAQAIDPEWMLSEHEEIAMAKWVAALAKQARKAKRNQRKLRNEFLEQRLRDSASAMAREEQREAIETILKRDRLQQNHRIIQWQLKQARTQLKCVIGEDRQQILGSAMPNAFVIYNAHHFQQPIRNGATTADGGDFCNGLRAYQTTDVDLLNNTFAIYEGRLQNPPSKNRKCPSMKASSAIHNHSQLSARRFHSMTSNDIGPPY